MSLSSNELPPHTSVVGDLRSWIQNSLRVHVTYQLKRKKKNHNFHKKHNISPSQMSLMQDHWPWGQFSTICNYKFYQNLRHSKNCILLMSTPPPPSPQKKKVIKIK